MIEHNGFKLIKDNFNMWSIQQLGSGAVPDSLKGDFTRVEIAKGAIDSYEPKRGAKKHVETNPTAAV